MSLPPSGQRRGVFVSRLGPKAAEDEDGVGEGDRRGLSLRAMLPNAITAAALCSGLTGVRFAIDEQWSYAIIAVIVAAVLDGIDGRIARLLNAQSRFGAELDSLADNISFGVAPAIILYLWSLNGLDRFGWLAALAFAICCALRLARFNAQIDTDEQPHKSAGFLTGVPAPVGAGISFLPFYLWQETQDPFFRDPLLLTVWVAAIAILLISNMATLSWALSGRVEVFAFGLLPSSLSSLPLCLWSRGGRCQPSRSDIWRLCLTPCSNMGGSSGAGQRTLRVRAILHKTLRRKTRRRSQRLKADRLAHAVLS